MIEVPHGSGPGMLFAIPTLGRPVPLEWALNFKSLNAPINYNVEYMIVPGLEIGVARNNIAKTALERGVKYLFFLGDDVVPPPHALRQLVYRMENIPNLGVVGGVYCAKADPAAPLVFKGNGGGSYWDWKIGEFFDVSGLGMDCTLIRMEVFRKLPEPWFKTVDEDGHIDAKPNVEVWTEDLYFLNKVAKETEYRICVDASIICDHWDVFGKRVYRLPKDSLPMRQGTTAAGSKKCLMLGPKLDVLPEFDVVRGTQTYDPTADYRLDFNTLPFDTESFDFVCITEQILYLNGCVKEWLRLVKPEGKLAFNLHPAINADWAMREFRATPNGSFLEIVKNG